MANGVDNDLLVVYVKYEVIPLIIETYGIIFSGKNALLKKTKNGLMPFGERTALAPNDWETTEGFAQRAALLGLSRDLEKFDISLRELHPSFNLPPRFMNEGLLFGCGIPVVCINSDINERNTGKTQLVKISDLKDSKIDRELVVEGRLRQLSKEIALRCLIG